MSEFKIGSRVKLDIGLTEEDYGYIVRPWNNITDSFVSSDPRWWVRWDSDGGVEHCAECNMVLVEPEITIDKSYDALIKEAAIKAFNNGDYQIAIRTIQLLLNDSND